MSELIVAISILGIVGVVLAGAFIVSARTNEATTTRFKESHDTQIASAYLANDVQSAAEITSAGCNGTGIVNFRYSDNALASYIYGTVDGENRLTRSYCDAGGSVVNNATLVHFASGEPTASCKGTGGWGTCNPAADPHPNKVKIAVTEGSDGYSFSLSGSRRIHANPASITGTSAFPPLLALGDNGVQIGLNGNHATLKVNGKVIVNSNAHPAVSGNTSNFLYGSIEIFGGGTCAPCGTTPISRATRVLDPLAGLPIPSTAGLPVNPPKVGNSYQPGIYTTTFSPDGTLEPGIYILQAGLNMAGQSHAVGDGVMLYITGGTSCASSGSFCVSGQAQLELSPMTSGTYKDITIWQDKSNTRPFSISGNGATSSIAGVIYLPTATSVTLGTGNGNLAIGAVIAPNVTAGGNGVVCIGYPSSPC